MPDQPHLRHMRVSQVHQGNAEYQTLFRSDADIVGEGKSPMDLLD